MFTFKVTPDQGEPWTVTAGPRDVLVWEKTNKGKTFEWLGNNVNMTDMYQLAWQASRREGFYTDKLGTFELGCEVEFAADEEPDPTPPGALAEHSSASPSQQASRPARGQTKAKKR